jgi:D-arabinose 1-dehydrogenase-like Zn-dependent alcohol dehydrogenase
MLRRKTAEALCRRRASKVKLGIAANTPNSIARRNRDEDARSASDQTKRAIRNGGTRNTATGTGRCARKSPHDGGYAEYTIAHAPTLALIPDDLPAQDAAPLMCAGVTTFNSLRHSGAGPGELVAVLGLGGLGHLGVQYAEKMGFKTVAIARGADKAWAREFTSTAQPRTPRRNLKGWAVPR